MGDRLTSLLGLGDRLTAPALPHTHDTADPHTEVPAGSRPARRADARARAPARADDAARGRRRGPVGM